MKGIIIGGGIGGLTTAIALQKQGIDFELFEAAPELKPIGAGIVMASNAMQIFQRLGIEKKIMDAGLEINEAYGVESDFKVISGVSVKAKIAALYSIGSFAIQRGRLQQVLLDEIGLKKIHLNKRLESVSQEGERVRAVFQDGTTAEADFLIGADGIKSAVRKSVIGDVAFRYSGQTCWRGMAKFTLPDDKRNNSYEMWGKMKGHRFGFVPTAQDEVYFFTTYFTDAGGADEPSKVKDKVLKLFAPFGKLPLQIIEATPEENLIRSDIYDFAPISKWWKGRITLLGDAAHATTPNLGQGGCQAVEDAFVIAKCLKECKSIEEAFEKYQSIRYAKAIHVVNMSWTFGKMTNIGNPIMQWLRNSMMRMMPESTAIKQLDKILRLNY